MDLVLTEKRVLVMGAIGVTRDVPAGERWAGFPVRPSRRFFRQYKAMEMLAA
ncbi:MAG: UDP-3-O-acylglucosamine N-acyltransferase, partial [Tardiphaga sp.]|nr:UDP-3-O-acylglucosamine N-acyltransferase [Tardiphaga sp.]